MKLANRCTVSRYALNRNLLYRSSPQCPRLMFHPRQVAAAVDHGQDVNVVALVQVDNAVVLEEQFPDVFSVPGFRHFPSQFREILQRFRRFKNPFGELPSIIRGVLGDIGMDPRQIFQCRFCPFNPHCPTAAFWLPHGTLCVHRQPP